MKAGRKKPEAERGRVQANLAVLLGLVAPNFSDVCASPRLRVTCDTSGSDLWMTLRHVPRSR
jgi:hypothetical protein